MWRVGQAGISEVGDIVEETRRLSRSRPKSEDGGGCGEVPSKIHSKVRVGLISLEGDQFRNYLFCWLCSTAREILVLQPGVKHVPPAVELRSLNHWTTRQVPGTIFQESFEAWAPKAIVESGSWPQESWKRRFSSHCTRAVHQYN